MPPPPDRDGRGRIHLGHRVVRTSRHCRSDKQQARADEDEGERLDRELLELLNELRVLIPGVQVLFGFLLTVPFQQRFAQVDDFQRIVYFVTLLLTAARAAFLMAPSAFHRLTFRAGQKPYLSLGTRQAIVGIALLALAMNGAMLLLIDVLSTRRPSSSSPRSPAVHLALVRAWVDAAASGKKEW